MTPYFYEQLARDRHAEMLRHLARKQLLSVPEPARPSFVKELPVRRPSATPPAPETVRAPGSAGPTMFRIFAALGVVYVVWGSTYLAIRVAVGSIPPLVQASVRFLIAGAILYALTIRRGDRVGDRPGLGQWWAALVIGSLLLVGGNGLVSMGEVSVPSGVTALMVASVPIWMVVFAHFSGQEKMRGRVMIGLAIGLCGVALLVRPSGLQSTSYLLGAGFILAATISWAIGSLYSQRAALPRRALVSTAMEMLAGGAVLAVLSAVTGQWAQVRIDHITPAAFLALAYLIVFGSIVAFSCYVWLLQSAPASMVGTYAFVNPVVAVMLGGLILSEPITPVTLIAGALIVIAVALVVTSRASARSAKRSEPRIATGTADAAA
jgi:drug/metabolite transporter (DMT)-like permease